MGHKPSNRIYPQKVVQPQIWFTLHFLPGTNIETFFCEVKIAMLSVRFTGTFAQIDFEKSIEGLGKKCRPTFRSSLMPCNFHLLFEPTISDRCDLKPLPPPPLPPSSIVGSYQMWVLFMLDLPDEQLSPRQPLKHSHLVVSFATIAIQCPLLLQGWGGRVQGVTSERAWNDENYQKVINHKEPANDLAPKYDLTGGVRTKTFGTDKPDRPQQGLPRRGHRGLCLRICLFDSETPCFQSNALSPIYGDDEITEI